MEIHYKVADINFNNNTIFITIDDIPYNFLLEEVSSKLKDASEMERQFLKVSPSGYGIHWPLIDEDLSIESLLHKITIRPRP